LVLVQEQYQEGQGMLLVEWKMVEVITNSNINSSSVTPESRSKIC
jgi:hypothetical protein